MPLQRSRNTSAGQSTVEFALLALAFFTVFFIVIQLALIAVAKHELNHLTFQAARVWSVQKSDKIDDAIKQAGKSFKAARGDSKMAKYLADNLTAKADDKKGRVTFTAYIPLLIPGAAHVMQSATSNRGSPTSRDVKATIVVQIRREPAVGVAAGKHPAKPWIRRCNDGVTKQKKGSKDPPCYDNDGL